MIKNVSCVLEKLSNVFLILKKIKNHYVFPLASTVGSSRKFPHFPPIKADDKIEAVDFGF